MTRRRRRRRQDRFSDRRTGGRGGPSGHDELMDAAVSNAHFHARLRHVGRHLSRRRRPSVMDAVCASARDKVATREIFTRPVREVGAASRRES